MPKSITHTLLENALLRGNFTLRSGKTSDWYFDKYRVTCEPALLKSIAKCIAQKLSITAPNAACIVAPELGAVAIAVALSLETQLRYIIVRGTDKSYGTARRIEGIAHRGESAILVEDVITSGGAALDAVRIATTAGLTIKHAFCILDRDGGGREALLENGIMLHSILTLHDITEALNIGLGQEAVN